MAVYKNLKSSYLIIYIIDKKQEARNTGYVNIENSKKTYEKCVCLKVFFFSSLMCSLTRSNHHTKKHKILALWQGPANH